MPIHVGTSGWTYKDWGGIFYPRGCGGSKRLGHYAAQFDTVEINATFYRFPGPVMLEAWNRGLPENFHLAVKGSRRVTHIKRLVDCRELVDDFLARVATLKNLRVVLWQLPPGLKKDLPRLAEFLGWLPRGIRHAIEFRDASWWDGEVEALLARHRAAFVAVSHPRLPATLAVTSDIVYVRFHGLGADLYRYDYSDAELEDWARRLRPLAADRTLYIYFNNDYNANAPRNAVSLRAMLADVSTQR